MPIEHVYIARVIDGLILVRARNIETMCDSCIIQSFCRSPAWSKTQTTAEISWKPSRIRYARWIRLNLCPRFILPRGLGEAIVEEAKSSFHLENEHRVGQLLLPVSLVRSILSFQFLILQWYS